MTVLSQTACWVSRWDAMQQAYNPDRGERLRTLVQLLSAKTIAPQVVLDVGCGTGTVMAQVLAAFPGAHAIGIDFDFTLLELARSRLDQYGSRVRFLERDLRSPDWITGCPRDVDAILSATALHWLDAAQLATVYAAFHQLLRKGGLFLNADHVGCEDRDIQQMWERSGPQVSLPSDARNPWQSFWDDFLRDRPQDRDRRAQLQGPWQGVEEGLPLEWHFLRLREAGFTVVDCFYRARGDAVYGAVR